MTRTGKFRQIKPRAIKIGMVIRWTTTVDDLTITNVGEVGSREHMHAATSYYTPKGHMIGTDYGDGLTRNTIHVIRDAAEDAPQTLPGLDALDVAVRDTPARDARKLHRSSTYGKVSD